MADHERIAPLVKLTAERGAKPLLVGDAAQLSAHRPQRTVRRAGRQGPHRRTARGPPRQPRVGAQGVATGPRRRTRTRARPIPSPRSPPHPRHPRRSRRGDGRELGPNRKTLANGQAVMITDASNVERDQMNAMAQERRVASWRAWSGPGRAARQALRTARRRRGHLHRQISRRPASSGSRTGSPGP